MKTYFRTLLLGGPYRWIFPLLLITVALSIIFQTLSFGSLAPILKVVFTPNQNLESITLKDAPNFNVSITYFKELFSWAKAYLTSGTDKVQTLKVICIALIFSVFLSNVFAFISKYIMAFVKARSITKLRVMAYNKINDLHLAYFSNEKRGDIISRLTNDMYEVETTIIPSAYVLIKEPLSIIFMFIVLFTMSFKLTVFTLLLLPISGLFIAEITRRLRKKAKKGQLFLGKILSMVDETLYGMKIIKSFNAQSIFNKKFLKENLIYQRTILSIDYKKELASPVSQFLGTSVVAIILYYGGSLVLQGKELAPEDFFLFIVFFSMVISPIKAITTNLSVIQRGIIAASRVFEIIDSSTKIVDKVGAKKMESFQQSIEFKNVSFAYQNESVLQNIELTIRKGDSIALVGPSGGGKSTLADLIPRFYDIQTGEIMIDGENIKNYTFSSLREQMGIVSQESILFNDTIYNNIAFGKPNATQEEIENAAKIANAHQFILEQEQGYQTEIGDRGSKLSGGQRQRISIARAILKNPPILILDEATSALDTESEKLVQEALENLMKNRTSIVIAHRLSTIKNATKIIVIKDGTIQETGNHYELIEQNGVYAQLYKLQM